ncbi:MAG: MgtC/SapB family protein [Comamonadaceae bacterium]|nr:MAG: MgtC/SapB family protein [Comamonadaceae bacterium]
MNGWLQEVGDTVAQEFSGLTDAAQLTRIVLRLTVAAVLGGLLGIERERHGKAAGVRTHMLVAMGSALFVVVSQQAGIIATDMSRVIQGLVAGIGFLGAGTIIKGSGEEKVKGLTTAAGIWMTAAIGVAAGLGLEVTAVLSTVLALGIFSVVPWMVRHFEPPVEHLDDKPAILRADGQKARPAVPVDQAD